MIRKTYRPGFSLLEMTILMSIWTTLMLIAAGWIHETMKFSDRTKAHRRQHVQTTRMARRFRDDVRTSKSMSLHGPRLVLTQRDETVISWEIVNSNVVEAERQLGEQLSRDRFRFAADAVVKWDTGSMPARIGLVVKRQPVSQKKPDLNGEFSHANIGPVDIHVFATPNRWPVVQPAGAAEAEESP